MITQKKSLIITLAAIGVVIAVFISVMLGRVFADYNGSTPSGYPKPAEMNSQGRMVFAGEDEQLDTSDDVIFDSQDLYYLYEFCK